MATNGKSIKEMMKSGKTAEELIAQLQKEIDQANAEIAQEKKEQETKAAAQQKVIVARENLLKASMDYLTALGVIQENLTTKELEEIRNELIKIEPELQKAGHLDNIGFSLEVSDDDGEDVWDKIISDFITMF